MARARGRFLYLEPGQEHAANADSLSEGGGARVRNLLVKAKTSFVSHFTSPKHAYCPRRPPSMRRCFEHRGSTRTEERTMRATSRAMQLPTVTPLTAPLSPALMPPSPTLLALARRGGRRPQSISKYPDGQMQLADDPTVSITKSSIIGAKQRRRRRYGTDVWGRITT